MSERQSKRSQKKKKLLMQPQHLCRVVRTQSLKARLKTKLKASGQKLREMHRI